MYKRITNFDFEMMREAIKYAYKGIKDKQGPFGAVIIVKNKKKIIAKAHNTVVKTHNPIMHAEIGAIIKATRKLKAFHLKECVIYSTCEPCPMCFTAIHWARIHKIIYGASIKDAETLGFQELAISNSFMKKKGGARMEIVSGVLKKECIEMMKTWVKDPNRVIY